MNISIVQTLSILRKYFSTLIRTVSGRIRIQQQLLERKLITQLNQIDSKKLQAKLADFNIDLELRIKNAGGKIDFILQSQTFRQLFEFEHRVRAPTLQPQKHESRQKTRRQTSLSLMKMDSKKSRGKKDEVIGLLEQKREVNKTVTGAITFRQRAISGIRTHSRYGNKRPILQKKEDQPLEKSQITLKTQFVKENNSHTVFQNIILEDQKVPPIQLLEIQQEQEQRKPIEHQISISLEPQVASPASNAHKPNLSFWMEDEYPLRVEGSIYNILHRVNPQALVQAQQMIFDLHYDRWNKSYFYKQSTWLVNLLSVSSKFVLISVQLNCLLHASRCVNQNQSLRSFLTRDYFFDQEKEKVVESMLLELEIDELRVSNFYERSENGREWSGRLKKTREKIFLCSLTSE